MANRNVHIPAGLISPWITLLIYVFLEFSLPFHFTDESWLYSAFFMIVFGFIGERTPETLEPPDDPRHRGVFHLVGGFIALMYLIAFFFTAPALPFLDTSINNIVGLMIISYVSGYSSHFILDYIPVDWD